HHVTRMRMDVEGYVIEVVDAHARICATFTYSMAGQLLRETSIDAGTKRHFGNVLGSPIRQWDSRDQVHRFEYDDVERPTHRWITRGEDDEELLQRTYYGEAAATPQVLNLRGQVRLSYDAAGQTKAVQYDFRGRLLET